jgi:hypothetical protein
MPYSVKRNCSPEFESTKTAKQTTLTDSDTATSYNRSKTTTVPNGAPVYDVIIVDSINGFTMDYLNLMYCSQ